MNNDPEDRENDSLPSAMAGPSRRLEIVVACLALAAVATFLWLSQGIESQVDAAGVSPQWWPTVLGGTAVGLSILLIIVALVRPAGDREGISSATRAGWYRVLATFGISAVFIGAWELVGFTIACGPYLVALILLYGGRGWKPVLLYPAAVTAFIYVTFDLLLKVPL